MPHASPDSEPFDVAVIGGGVNGCGITRDAAGRGAKVQLLEADDLASDADDPAGSAPGGRSAQT